MLMLFDFEEEIVQGSSQGILACRAGTHETIKKIKKIVFIFFMFYACISLQNMHGVSLL
jgi:hypothetical protein